MTTLTLAKEKAPNLTAVTVAPESVAAAQPDTTTPVDITIQPYTMRDTPKWGKWMQYRLSREGYWPHLTELNYTGFLAQHIGQNTSLFIRAKRAVMLAVLTRETFDPRPVIDIVFLFMHDPADKDQNKDVRVLVRAAEKWGEGHGARMIRMLDPNRIDATMSVMESIFNTKKLTYAAKVFA